MRKLSLFSLTGFAALGLLASPAQSGTIIQNDLPDFVVMDGETSEVDLSDFFASPSLDLTYEVEGGSVEDGGSLATVFAADGTFTATANDGEDTAESSGSVSVSDFLVTGLEVDDNNRVVGMDGGNLFLNGLVPGESFSSNAPLAIPEGGAGTPNGGTGAAALIATIGSVETSVDAETGLRVRSSSEAATGTGGEVSDGGLTATLNADGTYSIESTDEFSGTSVVSFGADTGDSADAVHMVVAESTSADVNTEGAFTVFPAGTLPQADVSYGDDGITISADAGQAILLIHSNPIDIDGTANISVDYEADAVAGVSLAALGFNGDVFAGTPGSLYYTNSQDLDSGVEKNVSTIISGSSIYPGVQLVNSGDAAVTFTISSLEVINAGPVMDYALNPNATADLGLDGSIADVAEWNADLNDQGAGAPTLSDENNFSTPGSAGSLELAPAGDLNIGQAWTSLTLGQGTYVAEAYAMGTEGTLTLFITNGPSGSGCDWSAAADGGDGWNQVTASGTNSNDGATYFLVVQGSGGTFNVDDVSVRVVDENEDDFVDMSLLGL